MKTIAFKILIAVFGLWLIISASCGSPEAKVESESASDYTATKNDEMKSIDEKAKSAEAGGEDSPDNAPALSEAEIEDIKAGLLTAGEWNDLRNWKYWLELMNSKEWSQMTGFWNYTPTDRVSVVVKNQTGKLLNDVGVILETAEGSKLWEAKTDIKGRAELWPRIFGATPNKLNIRLQTANGKTQTYTDINTQQTPIELELETVPQQLEMLDVMFVVDATGSMGDELEFLKDELQDIISRVEKQANGLKTQIGLVFYRDEGDEYVVRDFDFETNLKTVQQNLNNQFAGGGGDFEEAVEQALAAAIFQKRWSENARARLLFLILDAPPHNNPQVIGKLQKATQKAAQKGIKIIPIVASGIDKETEFLMRFVAIATNGTYVFLTDDSGVGESHLVPTIGDYQVELLNNLIVRLIMENVIEQGS